MTPPSQGPCASENRYKPEAPAWQTAQLRKGPGAEGRYHKAESASSLSQNQVAYEQSFLSRQQNWSIIRCEGRAEVGSVGATRRGVTTVSVASPGNSQQ